MRTINIPSFSIVHRTQLTKANDNIKFNMSVFYGFLAFCLFAGISANVRVRRDDDCPEVETVSNFNRTKYMGNWYQHGHYNGSSLNRRKNSRYIVWEDSEDGGCLRSGWIKVGWWFDESSLYVRDYYSVNPDQSKPGRFTFTHLNSKEIPGMTLWILDTDYKSYSVEYICGAGVKAACVLTKQRIPPESVVLKAKKVAEARGFKNVQYWQIDREW